jgi:NAD(P)-dependent dehydrogenase (short-subunit alcohol dehydrogenase family)
MKWPEELQFMVNARKPQKRTTARLDGKVCVVTGATSGVGYQAAKKLAQNGAVLALVCRNAQKAEKVRAELTNDTGAAIEIVRSDFARFADVRAAAATILEKFPRIDVLINNAGVHHTHRTITADGFETAFQVNHLSSFLFTRLLLDRIIASAPARILQINSQGHRFGGLDLEDLNWDRRRYRGLLGYGASKTAQLLTLWELADQLAGSGVTINAMHPGAVRTSIGMNNGLLYQWYQRYLLWPWLKSPEISGEAIYYLVAAPEMENVSGRFYNQTIEEKPAAHALDREMGQRIYKISEELTILENQ